MKKDFLTVKSAVNLKTYKVGTILFTLENYSGLYVGDKEHYQKLGTYDNRTGTLKKITDNEKLYRFLYGSFNFIVTLSLVADSTLNSDDIIELLKLYKKLNIKIHENTSESENIKAYKRLLKGVI